MPGKFLDRPRLWPLFVGGAVLLLFAVAVGLVIQQAMAPPRKNVPTGVPTYQPMPGAAPNTAPPSPIAPGATETVPLSGPLHIVRGERLINGLYVGFPHSTVGAVSAAVEYQTQLGSTLEPDRAAAVMRIAADSTFANAPTLAAQGPASVRKSLGLPTNGPTPAGASVVLSAVQYQVRAVSSDQVTVLLLTTYTTTVPGQGSQTRMGVFPLRMHWDAGDWKILTPDEAADYRDLAAEPGSPAASAKGWQVMTR